MEGPSVNIQALGAQNPNVTAVSGTTPTTMTSPPPSPTLKGTLAGVSQGLGMNVSSVQSALRHGMSISGLAQQQGVSRDALVKSVTSQIQQTRQANGQSPLDPTALEQMVKRAFGHHHRTHAAGAVEPSGFAALLDATSASTSASHAPDASSGTVSGAAGTSDGLSLFA
jgi:hypothetical protein